MKNLIWGILVSLVVVAAGAQTPPCVGNRLQNGTFSGGLVITGNGSMPASRVSNWATASRDPQLVSAGGCETAGFVAMWGNQVVGEAIHQTLAQPLEPGRTYRFSACVRYAFPGASGPVRFKVRVSGGPLPAYTSPAITIGMTPFITSTGWTTVTLPDWTAPTALQLDTITINPENQHAVDDGAKVSWGHIDNVCLQPVDVAYASKYSSVAACEKANNCAHCCRCTSSTGEGLCNGADTVPGW